MTVETRLRTAMAEAVAPFSPDADALVSAARRRGLGIRRRRQALGAVGVAAAVAVSVAAPSLVAGDHGARVPQPLITGSPTVSSLDTGRTSPFTGRSTAAALLYAVGQEAAGAATDFHGTDPDRGPMPETYAFFRFTPAGSATAGQIAINIQPDFFGTTAKPGDDSVQQLTHCQSWMQQCTATRLDDGSWLTTYDDRSDYQQGRGIRRVAALYRPDRLRVIVSATNGFDVTERDEQITRTDPVLTTEQLVGIVTQSWWGPRLPTYFVAQGAGLKPYQDGSASASVATAAPSAKP